MPVTRINNNQISDSSAGNVYVGINAGTKLQDYSLTAGKIANNLTYGSDLTVAGNLTVQGNTTTIDTVNVIIEDPLILLADGQTGSPTLDIGFIGKRGTSENIALVWDETAGNFVAAFTDSEVTNTTINITSYASFLAGNLYSDGALAVTGITTLTGNLITGNIIVDGQQTIDVGNSLISNVQYPVANTDAATKEYVDSVASSGFTIEDDTANTTQVSGGDTLQLLGTANEVTVEITDTDQVTFGLPDDVTVFGNLDAGNVNATDDVTATTMIASGNIEANNAVITNDVSTTSVTASGNVDGANVNATTNVTSTTVIASGNVEANNAVITNDVSTTSVTASGNVDGANLNATTNVTATTVTASGNVEANNAVITNDVSTTSVTASGNVDGANVNATTNVTATTVIASGNVEANNAVITNDVSTTSVTASGNVDGANLNATTNVTSTTVIASGNIEANNAVITNDVSTTSVTASGNVDGANVNATTNVTATTVIASGNVEANNAVITNDVSATTLTASGNVNANNAVITNDVAAATITASGNIDGANLNISDTVYTTDISGASLTVTTTGNIFLAPSGGLIDMGGAEVTNVAEPTQASDAATKLYVDTAVSTGITIHDPVDVETPDSAGSLAATYAQGGTTATVTDTVAGNTVVFSSAISPQVNDQYWFTSSFEGIVANIAYFVVSAPNTSAAVLSTAYNGVPVSNITSNTGLSQSVRINSGQGATLTATANGAITVDGYALSAGNRVLVYNQNTAYENGVYDVTDVGNVTAPYILTRSSDMDTYIPDNINGVDAGDYFFVKFGDTGAGESYVMTAPVGPVIIGYDGLTFTQFSASSTYTANTNAGLVLNGTIFSAKVDNDTTAFGVGGNIIVKAGANLVTPNIGNATGNSLALSGNGLITATNIELTGNVLAGNVNSNAAVTGVTITASGNLEGNNAVITNDVSTTSVTASGNVDGANVNATTNVTSTTVIASGNVEANNAVITNDVSTTSVTASGNVDGANLNATTNVTATTVIASGNIEANNAVITNDVAAATATIAGNVSAGNVEALSGNITAQGGVFSGNVTAQNFIGNISGNIDAGGANTEIQFNDDDILAGSAAFTFDKTSNLVTVSGNVSAGNVISQDNVEGVTVTASGNVNANNAVITNDVSTTSVTASGNVDGANLNATTNVTSTTVIASGNVEANNAVITNDVSTTSVTASGNVDGANVNATTNVTATTVIASGNIEANNAVITNDVGADTGSFATSVTAPTVNGGNITISGDSIDGNNGIVIINDADADVDFAVNGDTTANIFYVDAGSETASFGSSAQTTGALVAFNSTDSILLPIGNTAQRPSAVEGMFRYNTTDGVVEWYDGVEWKGAASDFTVIVDDSFNGDGSTTTFTLSQDSTTAGTIVTINGVVQIPTTAYSVTGNSLQFTEAPEVSDTIDARILTTTATINAIEGAGGALFIAGTGEEFLVTGNLIPSANVTYDLGNSSQRWNELFLAGSTITLGNIVMKNTSGNTIGFFGPDGVTPATLDANTEVVGDAIESGTSNVSFAGAGGNVLLVAGGNTTGTVTPTGLVVTGSIEATAGFIGLDATQIQSGTSNVSVVSSGGNVDVNVAGSPIVTFFSGGINNRQANGVGNIGTATSYFNTVFAKATSAQYADLAEMYEADQIIEPGTVVCFGGAKEVMVCDEDSCRRIAGVVSTNPSYIMNAGLAGDNVVAVALTGRVPTRVTGTIRKGDMLVAAGDGRARAEADPATGAVIGKALADFDGADGVIEVVVGRL